MEKIAFINGGTFIYWSSIVMGLAVAAAIALFISIYLFKGGNIVGAGLMVPLSIVLSLVLARLIHWYSRTDSYASFQSAMTDYTTGGFALMGVFLGCILAACILRLVRVVKSMWVVLDSAAIAGGVGIAVGRLASLFNTSARGMLMPEGTGLPLAWAVTNTVSGVEELRLATFMLQSITTLAIVALLLVFSLISKISRRKVKDGDIFWLFLAAYGASQILFDSTRYDSLYLRSNGFISIVQILGLVGLVLAVVVFSVRMVKANGLKIYDFVIWVAQLAALGGAGYMEYHVQRHGDQALFAYSVMSGCLILAVLLTVLIRAIAVRAERKEEALQELLEE